MLRGLTFISGVVLAAALLGCGMAERFHKAGLWHQKSGRLALAQNDLQEAALMEPENAQYQRDLEALLALREKLGGVVVTSSSAVQAALQKEPPGVASSTVSTSSVAP